jgi:TolB protein
LTDVDRGLFHVLYADENAFDRSLAWSPDGSQLAFASNRDGSYEIYLMNGDGSSRRQLTHDSILPTHRFVWSPDGSQIAFVARPVLNSEIFVVDTRSGLSRNLTNHDSSDEMPVWSPDGSQIAFLSNRSGGQWAVHIMDSNGAYVRRVGDMTAGYKLAFDWSPNSNSIAFVSYSTGSGDIYTINADGTNLTRISDSGDLEFNPIWSPDGTQIAFMGIENSQTVIFTINADGSSRARLAAHPEPCDEHHAGLAWSHDRNQIAFGIHGDQEPGVYVMDTDGSYVNHLFYAANDKPFPVWRP